MMISHQLLFLRPLSPNLGLGLALGLGLGLALQLGLGSALPLR